MCTALESATVSPSGTSLIGFPAEKDTKDTTGQAIYDFELRTPLLTPLIGIGQIFALEWPRL